MIDETYLTAEGSHGIRAAEENTVRSKSRRARENVCVSLPLRYYFVVQLQLRPRDEQRDK